jgi:3-hydroxybutyryl-CoA dehydrogenase
MKIAVLANESLKEELCATSFDSTDVIQWFVSYDELSTANGTDAVMDLLFEQNGWNSKPLEKFLAKPVIVNSVIKTTQEIGFPFIRINGWPTFLKRTIAEAACNDEKYKPAVEKIFSAFNRKTEWAPDVKGFVSARVVSMIINEAYFALEEKVSSKDEMDLAMKLGSHYPYGPFEWAEKIGVKNIAGLLNELSLTEKRYQPASLLLKEALKK